MKNDLKKQNASTNPLVSVIVPVYNVRRYIIRCIRSLMRQTYENIEIIVIDDGSTDGSGDIVRHLAQDDRRFVILRKENGGLASARNKGMSLMRGEYFTFVDSDDFVSNTYIQDLLDVAISRQARLVVGGYTRVFTDQHGKLKKPLAKSRMIPKNYERFSHEEWAIRISVSWGKLYHRSLIEKYHVLFDEKDRFMGGEDMPFSLFYTSMCNSIAVSPTAGYYYLQRSGSLYSKMRSSTTYYLPFRPLLDIIQLIEEHNGPENSRGFYEWFIVRIMAAFVDLSRGSGKKAALSLSSNITMILDKGLKKDTPRQVFRLFSGADAPFQQQLAVRFLLILYRTKLLPAFLRLWCSFSI